MKNQQALILLFISNIISGFAQGISMIAIPWYFTDTLDQSSTFNYFYAGVTFLTLFWGIYAGTIIDRYSRKKVFIYTNLICGIIIGLISIYGFKSDYIPSYLILLVFGLTIFNYNIHYPNLYAFGQEITDKSNYGKLNSYIEVQGQVTSMFAGAFATILLVGGSVKCYLPRFLVNESGFINILREEYTSFRINKWGIEEIFMMDAITYFIGIILFALIRYSPVKKEDIDVGSLFSRLKGGIHYLRQHPSIFRFGVLTYMLFAFTLVEVHVLLPRYVESFLKESGSVYASAEIFYSFGAMLSGILVYKLLSKFNTYLSIILLITIVSFAFLGMSFSKSIIFFFLANLLLGITNAGVRILRTTYLFSHVPNNLMGRATSVFSSINVMVRMSLILFFGSALFQGENVRLGYYTGSIMLFATIILLYLAYLLQKKKTI